MPSQIADSDFTTLIAAIPAPYGPLVRVGSVPDMDPNLDFPIKFTSALGKSVNLSYRQILDGDYPPIVEMAHAGSGMNAKAMTEIKLLAQTVLNLITSFGAAPYSDAEYGQVVDLFASLPLIIAISPNHLDMPVDQVVAGFVVTDVAAHTVHIVNATKGKYDQIMWDYGDGTVVWGATPANKVYASAGLKTIVQTVIGAGGIKTLSKSITIA